MNEKERAAMEQALEALEIGWSTTHTGKDARDLGMKAITALRAALEQEQADPTDPGREVDVLREHVRHLERRVRQLAQEKVEPMQEPVGQILPNWSTEKECIEGTWACLNDLGKNLPVGTKLYTAPPQREQVLLTDEEIDALPWNGSPLQFARAVENASLEKNK